MTVLKITEYPARVLFELGEPVTDFNEKLATIVKDMFETMYSAPGLGLAASQIGLSLRLFVTDCDGLKIVAANPELIEAEGLQLREEGCLSLRKLYAPLERAERVLLRAQNIRGEVFEQEANGLAARCIQHETDHCNGILFTDRLSLLTREILTKKFLKRKKQH